MLCDIVGFELSLHSSCSIVGIGTNEWTWGWRINLPCSSCTYFYSSSMIVGSVLTRHGPPWFELTPFFFALCLSNSSLKLSTTSKPLNLLCISFQVFLGPWVRRQWLQNPVAALKYLTSNAQLREWKIAPWKWRKQLGYGTCRACWLKQTLKRNRKRSITVIQRR